MTFSSPALFGGALFNPKGSEAKGTASQVGSGLGSSGFPLSRGAVTPGVLSSPVLVYKCCWPPLSPRYTRWSYERARGGCGGREPRVLLLFYTSTLSASSRD